MPVDSDWEKQKSDKPREGVGLSGLLIAFIIGLLAVVVVSVIVSKVSKKTEAPISLKTAETELSEKVDVFSKSTLTPTATITPVATWTQASVLPTPSIVPTRSPMPTRSAVSTATITPLALSTSALRAQNKPIWIGMTSKFQRMEQKGVGVPSTFVPGEYVTGVSRGSPASRAGIEIGDLIIEVEGRQITAGKQFLSKLSAENPQEVSLRVLRRGRPLDLVLVVPAGE